MKVEEISPFLETGLKPELEKVATSQLADQKRHIEDGRVCYRIKARVLLDRLSVAVLYRVADYWVRNPENILGWDDTVNSLLEIVKTADPNLKADPVKASFSRFIARISESTLSCLSWFISFIKEDYDSPPKIEFPHSKSTGELSGLGLIIICYYMSFAWRMPIRMNLKADILSYEVFGLLESQMRELRIKGSREIDRTKRANIARKNAKSQNKQLVMESYYQIGDITKDTKPFTAARIIHKRLESKTQGPPSIKTILRYLREEKLVSK